MTQWTTDPKPPREEALRLINGGALADIQAAFEDGVLIGMEKQVIGNGNDLEIKIVLRHKSALPSDNAA